MRLLATSSGPSLTERSSPFPSAEPSSQHPKGASRALLARSNPHPYRPAAHRAAGPGDRARRSRLRRGADGLRRRRRPPARGDRRGRPTPPTSRASSRSPARPALELAVRSGGHSNGGHGVTEGGIVLDLRDMRGARDRRRRPDGLGRDRADRRRVLAAAAEHGLGDRLRRHRLGRDRRDHPRRRGRLPRAQARAHHRRPAGRRGRHRGRRARCASTPTNASRPVLGDPRRRRQLRRRHPLPVPAPRCRAASSAGCSSCRPRPR